MVTLPHLSFLGALSAFDYNVGREQITLTLDGAMLKEDGRQIRLSCTFNGVVFVTIMGEPPTIISEENGCDDLHEITESPLLRSLSVNKLGWTMLSTPLHSIPVARPPADFRPRHFVVHSSFLHGEWLCTELTVEQGEFEP